MATAPAFGRVMRNSSVVFDSDEFAAQLTKVVLEPDVPSKQLRTLVPSGVLSDVDDPTWVLQLSGPQDWTAAQGLAEYLTTNSGTEVVATVTPRVGGVTATVSVILKAVTFGGTQGDWETFETELPVVGQPEFDESSS